MSAPAGRDTGLVSGNAEIVRRLYEAFNRRDTAAARELMDPDVEWVNPDEAIEPGTRSGYEQYQGALGRLRDSFSEASVVVDRLHESGERVAAVVRLHVRARESGVELELPQSHLWTFRGGKAVRFEWFNDPERAMRDLGDTSAGTP